jgi:alcohol dehydrogenase
MKAVVYHGPGEK